MKKAITASIVLFILISANTVNAKFFTDPNAKQLYQTEFEGNSKKNRNSSQKNNEDRQLDQSLKKDFFYFLIEGGLGYTTVEKNLDYYDGEFLPWESYRGNFEFLFNPFDHAGFGFGLTMLYSGGEYGFYSMPIYGSFRINFHKSKSGLFIPLRAGWDIMESGFYWGTGLGLTLMGEFQIELFYSSIIFEEKTGYDVNKFRSASMFSIGLGILF